ncbi:cupin domain-containing protein [Pseudarthrobacter oxydans]|uniref:helix-turn-helix domain-containing protein n=1 Tax=Pseudarthrobacter oxydans TaxID=1671 RepID=UPI001571C431|nr:cupin domain-containing protein [Pseudarthrobacter oxydans]NSX39000.1 cupin domain-containing protein [Pseudarthrobacter oxydans]
MESTVANENTLGERLHELRTQHRYSIRGLATKAGVSASLVSDVEKGKVEPSISTLNRLAAAMGTTITYFFTPQAQPSGRVVRAADRVPFGGIADPASDTRPASGTRFELASPTDLRSIDAIYGRYEVGGWFGDEPFTHEGEEWGFVLSGRLKVIVGDEVHFLEPGDSIWFPSTVPHRMENVADTATEYIWIDIPPGR